MSEKKLLDIQNIQQLKPAGFWKAFYEINQVPRGTKNEKSVFRTKSVTQKSSYFHGDFYVFRIYKKAILI